MKKIIYLHIVAMFVMACGTEKVKNDALPPQTKDSIYTQKYCDCSFSDPSEAVVQKWLADVRKNSQEAIMLHRLDTCLVHDDFVYIHNQGIDYLVQIGDNYITFNKSKISVSAQTKDKSFKDYVYIAQPKIIQKPKDDYTLEKLNNTEIWAVKPLGGMCMGNGCLILKTKKNGLFTDFTGLSQQDTLFRKACKEVQILIEQELDEAGITF